MTALFTNHPSLASASTRAPMMTRGDNVDKATLPRSGRAP